MRRQTVKLIALAVLGGGMLGLGTMVGEPFFQMTGCIFFGILIRELYE